MAQKITDEYGNTIGKIENDSENKYVVRDNYGNKVVTAKKEFLGENYEIRDINGNFVGKTEKEFLGNKTFVKDRSGNTIGSFEPSGDIGTGILIALAAVIFLVIISIKSVPETLSSLNEAAWFETEKAVYLNPAFFCITIPLIIMGLVNIIFLALKKDLFPNTENFWQKLLKEIFLGAGLYLGSFFLMTVHELINRGKFFETVFIMIVGSIMYLFTYLILMIPLAFILTSILKFLTQKNKQHF